MDSRIIRAVAVVAAVVLLSFGVSGVGDAVFPVLSRIGPGVAIITLAVVLLLSRGRDLRPSDRTDIERRTHK